MLCIILTEIEEMSMCLVMFCSMVGLIWMFGFQFFYIFLQFIPGWWFGTFFSHPTDFHVFQRGRAQPPTDRWPPAEVHRPQRFGDESVQITQWKLRPKTPCC